MENIKNNLTKIRQNISAAARKSGRDASDITLIAVTKTVPADIIAKLPEYGVTAFGENRPQELAAKHAAVPGCEWHMIGNLQKNKIKHIIDRVVMIQSVDSLGLAAAIDKAAASRGIVRDILLEINIAGEASKHGIPPSEALETARAILCHENVILRGIMTIAPYTPVPEDNRVYFRKMFDIYVDIRGKIDNNAFNVLSMGMSGDYTVAIEEGATMVRIGTAVFADS